MRRLIRHESLSVRYRRLLYSQICLLPTSILGALNLCLLFTFILMILFVFSLCLILLFFVNVTHLEAANQLENIPLNTSLLGWNSFATKLKYERRSKHFSSKQYSNILSESNHTKFNFKIIHKPNESQKRCLNFQKTQTNETSLKNLVIVIHSACNHSLSRRLMRQQLTNVTNKISISYLFVLGTSQNETLMNDIHKESMEYSDILQLDFHDTYQNLTLKHISSLRWPLENCVDVDVIVKLDDDAFIDLRALIIRLDRIASFNNWLGCSEFPDKTLPKRHGKWALNYEEYPFETYPFYCSGVGYFLTPDVAFDLLDTIQHRSSIIPVLKIDDVFITGIVRSLLKPQPLVIKLNDQFEYKASKMKQWLNDEEDHCPSGMIIADIGDQHDRVQLTIDLLNKTNVSWLNFAKCTKFYSKSLRLSL